MTELLELQQNYVTSLQSFIETFDLARSSYDRTFSEVLRDAQLQRFHRAVEDLTHFYVGYCYLKHSVEAEGPQHLLEQCLKNKIATEDEVNGLSNLMELSEFFCSASSALQEEVEEARATFLPMAQTILTSFAYVTQELVKQQAI
jgi:hypothetical protein